MIKDNKLFYYLHAKLKKINKEFNKYLDSRSGLSEAERIEKCEALHKEEIETELELLEVDKEDIVIKSIPHEDKCYPYESKANFRPDSGGRGFDYCRGMNGELGIINY